MGQSEPLGLGDVTVDGVRSPVLEGGPAGDEEAVVFVHGNPGSSRDWESLAAQVAGFARVVAPDMPGYGRADKPVQFPYTIAGYAEHLDGVLTRLGVRRAHLVLHDLGGLWGLAWAAAHRDALASATLISTGVLPGYRWHYLARIWRTPALGEFFMATASRPAFHLLLKQGNPRGLPRAFVDRMYDDFDSGTRRAVLRFYRDTDDPSAATRVLARALAPLRRPALVVWGKADPYVPVRMAERQRRAFPDAEIVILGRSGHWPHADDAEAVAAAVLPFLRRQVAGKSPEPAASSPEDPPSPAPPRRRPVRRRPRSGQQGSE
jgi:pimeloyl-ACP methyl ester carboxylesterase